jgi:hypothetical protein
LSTAEPVVVLAMLGDLPDRRRVNVGANKAYDTAGYVAVACEHNVTPHVTQNINGQRGSDLDGRTTCHAGCQISQIIRKRIEEPNDETKTVAEMQRAPFGDLPCMDWIFRFNASAFNLVRLPGLLATGSVCPENSQDASR